MCISFVNCLNFMIWFMFTAFTWCLDRVSLLTVIHSVLRYLRQEGDHRRSCQGNHARLTQNGEETGIYFVWSALYCLAWLSAEINFGANDLSVPLQDIDVAAFCQFVKLHHNFLFPAFELQMKLQDGTLGETCTVVFEVYYFWLLVIFLWVLLQQGSITLVFRLYTSVTVAEMLLVNWSLVWMFQSLLSLLVSLTSFHRQGFLEAQCGAPSADQWRAIRVSGGTNEAKIVEGRTIEKKWCVLYAVIYVSNKWLCVVFPYYFFHCSSSIS